MLENDICRVEYAIAKRHNVLGEIIRSSDCSRLPSTECRSLGLPVPEPSDKSNQFSLNNVLQRKLIVEGIL